VQHIGGGAQGGVIRWQLQNRDITGCLLAFRQALTAGLKGPPTCDF
jgi:hypothetical protein